MIEQSFMEVNRGFDNESPMTDFLFIKKVHVTMLNVGMGHGLLGRLHVEKAKDPEKCKQPRKLFRKRVVQG